MIGRLRLCIAISALWIATNASLAQQHPPLPPARPKMAPATPAAPPAPINTDQQPQSFDEEVGTLPPPRDRIQRCATEWRDLKRNGADVGTTWRSFAQACFKRR
jgi:hypothetical protein